MHDTVYENNCVEGSGAQRHGPHAVESERTVKPSAGLARYRQLLGFLTPRSFDKLEREGLF